MSYKMRTKVVVTAGLCAALTLTGASVAIAETAIVQPGDGALANQEGDAPSAGESTNDAASSSDAVFVSGEGTEQSPYIVSTLEQFKAFRDSVNAGNNYAGKHVKLAASVDLSGEAWVPIGEQARPSGAASYTYYFAGTFDGGATAGVVIKGLNNNGYSAQYAGEQTYGLFGVVKGATIKNVALENVSINASAGDSVGALVGQSGGAINIDSIEIRSGSIYGADGTGGVIGRAYDGATGSVKNCVNKATVTGGTKAAGIVGWTSAPSDGGGVVIENCFNYGAIGGKDTAYASGIVGGGAGPIVKNNKNHGPVESSTVSGGIVASGYAGLKVEGCFNDANISSIGESGFAGGVLGSGASGGAQISGCANTGAVAGAKAAGGIIGGSESSGDFITNGYNAGKISVSRQDGTAAGIYAGNNSSCPVKACYNDGAVDAPAGATTYQIGKSGYWFSGATGSMNQSCYYRQGDEIYLAAADGKDPGTKQELTRTELANALNTAGGVSYYWQAQNGTVQPDSLIAGAMDDESVLEAQILDASGNVIEGYPSLAAAVDAAQDGQTVKLTKGVTLSTAYAGDARYGLNIDKAITLDGAGFTIDCGAFARGIRVVGGGTAEETKKVVFKDVKITNKVDAGRCVDTRGGYLDVTFSDADISETGAGNTSALVVGGSHSNPASIHITNGSTLTTGNAGYAFMSFNPVNMTIDGKSKLYGYAALYFKGEDNSVGSKGSKVEVTGDATLESVNPHPEGQNGFGTIVFEDGDIDVSVKDANIIASATGESTQSAILFSSHGKQGGSVVKIFDGGNVEVKGELASFADENDQVNTVEVSGGTFNVPVDEKYCAEGYRPVDLGDGKYGVEKEYVPPSGGGTTTPSDKTEVEHNQDGSTTTTVTKPDGSQTITHETATGTESVVKKDEDGNVTSTEVAVSEKDAESGKVELPLADAKPATDVDKAPEVEVKVPSSVTADKPVQVTVPVAKGEAGEPNHGVVVFAVDADGNETVIPKCSVDKDGNVVFEATGDVTIKVVDNAKEMPDVTDADWFAGDVVDFATARGIVNGVDMPDGTKQFQGYGRTSRGMLVAMLHNLELNPEAASEGSLADVPSDAFYADAAAWALEKGILSGVDMPDGSKQFQGNADVTREQVAVFLMRYADHLGMDVSERAEIEFPDASEVSGFAKDAMSWAVANGLFTGDDVTGELNPADGAARAEVATVLMRFINLMYA